LHASASLQGADGIGRVRDASPSGEVAHLELVTLHGPALWLQDHEIVVGRNAASAPASPSP